MCDEESGDVMDSLPTMQDDFNCLLREDWTATKTGLFNYTHEGHSPQLVCSVLSSMLVSGIRAGGRLRLQMSKY